MHQRVGKPATSRSGSEDGTETLVRPRDPATSKPGQKPPKLRPSSAKRKGDEKIRILRCNMHSLCRKRVQAHWHNMLEHLRIITAQNARTEVRLHHDFRARALVASHERVAGAREHETVPCVGQDPIGPPLKPVTSPNASQKRTAHKAAKPLVQIGSRTRYLGPCQKPESAEEDRW